MKKGVSLLVVVALMALASSLASASDPSPLQDTCVAIDEPKNAGICLVTNDLITIFINLSIDGGFILMIYLFFSPFFKCSICKWKVLQEPKPDCGRGFLLSRAEYSRKHNKSSGLKCHYSKC